METPTRTNYIFVDYENVQEFDLDLIAGKPVKVFLLIGRQRKSLPLGLVRQIHRYHDQVQLIESQGASRNALDLVLAYHVGAQAKADPQGYFHVLAKDKDYDPLITHLRADGLRANREDLFSAIPVLIDVNRLTLPQRLKWVAERLQKIKANRPTRRKSLLAALHAMFHKKLPEEEVQELLSAMLDQRLIELSPQGGVAYRI